MNRIFITIKELPKLLKETFISWNNGNPFNLSAIVAYYAIFSLPALLIIMVSIAGAFFGKEAVRGQIVGQIGSMIGKESAVQIQTMISNAVQTGNSTIATIIGIATLLYGATGVFFALQQALNEIWNVKADPKKSGIKRFIKVRALSFGIILAIGFLLIISLVVSALLSVLGDWLLTVFPEFIVYILYVLNFIFSFAFISLLFALLFKYLPDAKIEWKSVWMGAILTTILFVLGKYALSFYFGKSNPGSTYGAAGSLILMLLWVSYSSLILFFGAEFTQVFARAKGHNIEPTDEAVRVEEKEC